MNKTISIDDLQTIWEKVTLLHGGQTYGGHEKDLRIEYINHIGSVVFEVFYALQQTDSFDGELAITCALLHDTIEDTAFTKEELTELYGHRIADGVLALTKNTTLPKEQQMPDSLQRIMQQPKEVWAVKMADRICNLYRPPHYWDNEKKLSYLQEARDIHAHLHSANVYLSNRLLRKIEAYKKYLS
ncbi:HD domain-containing protein [Chitinophaga sp. YR627]|uniref:HD domain-containing protein n=1 Tax=Chitinophaga sp. YR627 TaxID=1881041 RepID=UPI0008E4FFAD|nr:HD domain-containing protein [Chitinophaga sp. YR627]SFO74708.1 HD domain-containing protein [Chitinophaga sp. YR627]